MSQDDPEPVKGQIIISLMSRDGTCGGGTPLAIVGPGGDVHGPDDDEVIHDELPEGWEDRRTPQGRIYYVNHVTKTTQWPRPSEPASPIPLPPPTQNGSTEPLPAGPSRSSTTTCITNSIPANESTNNRRHSTEIMLNSNNKENCNSNKDRTKDEQIMNLNNRLVFKACENYQSKHEYMILLPFFTFSLFALSPFFTFSFFPFFPLFPPFFPLFPFFPFL